MQETENSWAGGNWSAWQERYGQYLPPEYVHEPGRVEIITSRTGLPTVRVRADNGHPVFLHSSVDPVKEAQRVAADVPAEPGAVVIVYGFGLGYLVEALLAQLSEKVLLFVLEPDSELFHTVMETRDIRPVIGNERVVILVHDSAAIVKDVFFRFYDPARFKQVLPAGLPGHQTVYEGFCAAARKSILDARVTHQVELKTAMKLGPGAMTSTILNLVNYYTHPGLRALYGRFADRPAIIVSAGPSLNKNIDLLHEAKGKAVILAVGTAAKALQKRGIEPDFIVSIDPGLPNYEHFKGLNTTQSCLITESYSHHFILEEFAGPMFVCGRTPVHDWFGELLEDKGKTESGGSVANNAFTAAYKMGANPIILIGQDLAFAPDGRTHAAGTTYENDVVNRDKNRGYMNIKANDGGEVLTDAVFYQFLCFFQEWIKDYPDREYINATEGGAFIKGTQVMTLREALNKYCHDPIDAPAVIRQIQDTFKVPDLEPFIGVLHSQKKKMEAAIAETQSAISRLGQLKKACESKQGKKVSQHLAAIRKIYEQINADEFIAALPDWFAKQDIHAVMTRTHQAEQTEKDDFSAAIEDYHIYYEKIRNGAEQVRALIGICIQEAERRMECGR
ncbi:MAG TPA: DUF115 domain-containing protein [Selenomonadales bacterium]|nr:DUF115 domain-containing protein [Selenomonadales bacterium]